MRSKKEKFKFEIKKKSTLLLTFAFLLFTFISHAETNRFTNKVRVKREQDKLKEEIAKIPIYEEKLSGNYDILGAVYGQDALTSKKDGIIYQMRLKAFKAKADAIMEFKCKQVGKSLFRQCEGFAIKYQ